MKKLRKPPRPKEGKLRGADGIEVWSEERADTLAKYLEDIQWAVRPATLVNDHAGQPLLPVELRAITLTELKEAVNAMKPNKVPGMDGHPVEFWKAVIKDTESDGATWLLLLCNLA